MSKHKNRYEKLIEAIFFLHYKQGSVEVYFSRQEIIELAGKIGVAKPSNIGDILYTFRYRAALPESIQKTASQGMEWTISPAGRGKYKFRQTSESLQIGPNELLKTYRLPDATPGLISRYSLTDEQALLAKVRYNRLVDIFTRLTCYSMQNHLRSTVRHLGQVEVDELYVGIDNNGAHYIIPVQAKGGNDRLTIVQIAQDIALCAEKFPNLICRPIATQFTRDDIIVMYEFEANENESRMITEQHYSLVAPQELSEEELLAYRQISRGPHG